MAVFRSPTFIILAAALAIFACTAIGVVVALRGKPANSESADMSPKVLAKLLETGENAEWRDDWNSAEEQYRQAITLFPRHARAWAHYGEFQRFYRHNDDEATRAFQRTLEAPIPDPTSAAYAWRGLGEIAEKQGDNDKALELMQKSLRAGPLSDTHRSLSHLYGRLGNTAEAAKHAKAAAEIDPSDPIALLLYAAHLERSGNHDEAQNTFKKAIALGGCDAEGQHNKPVHCCVFYNSAGYYAVRGDNPGALKMLEAFFETPNHRHLAREHVLDDPDFVELKKDPEFMKLLDRYLPAAAASTK